MTTPLAHRTVMGLKAGDAVSIRGRIITAEDRAHKFLFNEMPSKKDVPFSLEDSFFYHCGPVIKKTGEAYKTISAGPSSSIRFEIYAPLLIKKYGIKAIVGKGGMGRKTLDSLKENGAVYLQTVSAGVFLADRIKRVVKGWKKEEFGISEAMWLLEAEDLPAIVAMDAHGNSLYDEAEKASLKNLNRLLRQTS